MEFCYLHLSDSYRKDSLSYEGIEIASHLSHRKWQLRCVMTSPTDFNDALEAYRFILSWNGNSVYELKDAISYVRFEGAGSIQSSLLELMDTVCKKLQINQPVADHLQHKPLWAVDSQGRALVGIPGHERVVEYFDNLEFVNT
jgi:hypothetical protein